MGFRNPITSATGVDTGPSPTGPGARLFQDLSGEFPRGLLEMRSGLSGDIPAGAVLTSYQTTGPDGSVTSAGNRFAVRGGGTNGVTPAELDLDIEENPAGGYRSAATLRANRIAIVGGPITLPGDRARANIPLAAPWAANTEATYEVINRVVWFQAAIVRTTAWTDSVFWSLETALRPARTHWFRTTAGSEVRLTAAGTLTVLGSGAANATVAVSGQWPIP